MSAEEPQRPASLKHELRTPLNHIIGYAEMSIEDAQDHGQDAFIPDLQRIHSAGRRLLILIDELVLYMARATAIPEHHDRGHVNSQWPTFLQISPMLPCWNHSDISNSSN